MRRAMLGSLVALAVLGAACGDDDDAGRGSDGPKDHAAYVEAISTVIGGSGLEPQDIDCVAEAMVDALGVEQLQDKVTPAEIQASTGPADFNLDVSEDQGNEFYDKMNECVDVREFFLASASTLAPGVRDCLDASIDDDELRQAIVATFLVGSSDAQQAASSSLTQAYTECAAQADPGTGAPEVPSTEGSTP
jgi:hypothetical protein